MGYEKWEAAEPHKNFSLNYVGVASGYLMGHITTVTTHLYAASHTDAMKMFNIMLESAGMVNLSDYHVTIKDA